MDIRLAAGVYNRAYYRDEVRDALHRWAVDELNSEAALTTSTSAEGVTTSIGVNGETKLTIASSIAPTRIYRDDGPNVASDTTEDEISKLLGRLDELDIEVEPKARPTKLTLVRRS
jgi:hypothetical protein